MQALNTLADPGVTIWDYSTGRAVDLDSFEGEMMTFMKARFAQQERDQARKRARDSARHKAEQGWVTGGKTFGYDNRRIVKGQTTWVPNDAEAAVVREIYELFADGAGARTIAGVLNRAGAPSPRSQQGRPNGWSASTVRAVLERPLYRGEVVFGRTTTAYGRELGKRSSRESGQIPKPETTWIRRDVPELRIIDADLAKRVDARRRDRRSRYLASLARGGRVPQRAHGKYLLSGGMLICPTCGGHIEALKSPWKDGGVYVCALLQRVTQWKADLRAVPKVARLLLRRLVEPLTLADPGDFSAFQEWEASLTPALLEGLIHHVASPGRFSKWDALGKRVGGRLRSAA